MQPNKAYLERKRRKTLAIESRLPEPVPNLRDSSVRLPENEGLVDLFGDNLELNNSLISERISVKSFGYEELCIGLLFVFLIGIQLGIELGIWNINGSFTPYIIMNKSLDSKGAQRLLKSLESDPRLQAPDDVTILSDE